MLRDQALAGKTILVTGGGSGLGRAMTRYFLQLGAHAVITSRSIERLEKTARELEAETGGRVLPVACDVRNYEMVENVLERAVETFGRVDVLVNNAAGNFVAPTEKLSHRAFDTVVDIVLKGTYNCTLALGKYWIAQQIKGVTLNIVTTYAWTGSPFVAPSACAKAGVLALTRSLAVEWGRKYGMRTNAIAPGPFPTPGAWERLMPAEAQQALNIDPVKQVPLGRTGDHQELANLAAYLVSDFASFVNGEVVTIDGGEWLSGAGEFSYLEVIPDAMWDSIIEKGRQIKT